MKKIIVILMAALLVMSGCQAKEDSNDTNAETENIIDEENTQNDIDEPEDGTIDVVDPIEPAEDQVIASNTAMENFEALLTPEYSADYIGLYISEHINQVTAEEADEMIEWLIIYQTQLSYDMNNEIYNPLYMDALNQTLGGTLNPDKVKDIKDDQVRHDYQALVDAYLTIVRYEETPVIETDWERLAALRIYCSDDFSAMMDLRSESQFIRYEDFYTWAQAIVKVEDMIEVNETAFIKGQLEAVHSRLVAYLFFGPEGSYIETFMNKSGETYDDLITFASDYNETGLGQFIQSLDDREWDDYTAISEFISSYTDFGFNSEWSWISEPVVMDGVSFDVLRLVSSENTMIANNLNTIVDERIEKLLLNVQGVADYSIYMYTSYQSDKYLSLGISLSYTDEDDQYQYMNENFNYDLESSMEISLADYLGMDQVDVLQVLEDTLGIRFNELPTFSFNTYGISLEATKDDPVEVSYAFMSLKELIPYVDKVALYR